MLSGRDGKADGRRAACRDAVAELPERIPDTVGDRYRWPPEERAEDRRLAAGPAVELLDPARAVLIDLAERPAEARPPAGCLEASPKGSSFLGWPGRTSTAGGPITYVDELKVGG